MKPMKSHYIYNHNICVTNVIKTHLFFCLFVLFLYRAGSVIVETAVLFKRKPSPEEEDHVLQTFYEAVELNGTLGAFHVKELYKIDNRPGSYFVLFIFRLAYSIAIYQVLLYQPIL